MSATKTSILTEARARSISHNEIVHVEWESKHGNRAADAAMIQGHLAAEYDGEVASTWENRDEEGRDVLDIWGYQDDAPEGEMEWRLRVTIIAA